MARNPQKLLNGTGYTIHQGPDGFYLDIDTADVEVTDHPFKVKLKGLKYTVVPGTVNNIGAKLNGTTLETVPAPEGTISATCYVYLECQHNASEAFPKKVDVKTGTTVPASDEEFMYVTLAAIDVTSGKAKKTAQYIETSLSAEYFKCGDEDPEYFTSRT